MSVDVLLVTMPFAPINTPSLGLSLLKEALKLQGISAEIKYYNIEFARKIGVEHYLHIANGYPVNHDLLGEWIFSNYLFKKPEHHATTYFKEILLGNNPSHDKKQYHIEIKNTEEFKNTILSIIKLLPEYLNQCVQDLMRQSPGIIGIRVLFNNTRLPMLSR